MSLKSWIRNLIASELTEFRIDHDQDFLKLHTRIIKLETETEWNKKQLIRFDEILRMPIDFRLAQAKNSLNLLTEYINEIQRDQEREHAKRQMG